MIALVLALAIDTFAFTTPWVWRHLSIPENRFNLLELGVLRDRLEMFELEDAPETDSFAMVGGNEPSVFLIGASRLEHGFRLERAPMLGLSRERLVKLAHPQFFPFEMRAAAQTIAKYGPAIVVLALSELETHGQLELQPGSSFGNLASVNELIRSMGPAFAFEHRLALLRIVLMSGFDTYHYRAVLSKAGLRSLNRFDERKGLRRDDPGDERRSSISHPHRDPGSAGLAAIVSELDAAFPSTRSIVERKQFESLRGISQGDHATANLALLRRTVEILTDAGARVVILEPPIYPRARALYDAGATQEFVQFAQNLTKHERVTFVPLAAGPEYKLQDFSDLTHLGPRGASTFTRVVLETLARELAACCSDHRQEPLNRSREFNASRGATE